MSERTFYRRKADGKPLPEPQHAAHVAAWMATLGPFERLDYRALTRRCLRAASRQRCDVPVLEIYMRILGVN